MVQTAAGDFIKAIITISANASQNEQQCIGPNELTRQLVSKPCVEQLVGYMLGGGNPLTVGVGIIIEVIRKNNSDYDPDVGAEANTIPTSRDPIYLGTLLRLFADNVPKFMSLIMNGPSRKQGLASTFGEKLEPLGFDRFKTCELMAELLHCSNMGLLNEVGAEQLISTRDTERQRLRHEGKLSPREEENSTDDLTMRGAHSTHEESRRLEVTNADDDGFEEVEPSQEMGEDTSHEFVKAEDDILPSHPSSFLEKDDDEFVDEPLSSPRLSVGADKLIEQKFEEPDLVVAPLSPSKAKPAASAPFSEPVFSQTPGQSAENKASAEDITKDAPKHSNVEVPRIDTSSVSIEPLSSAPETLDIVMTGGLTSDESTMLPKDRGLSPHPEDTPAPLFSAPLAPDSGAQQPPQAILKAMAKAQADISALKSPTEDIKPTLAPEVPEAAPVPEVPQAPGASDASKATEVPEAPEVPETSAQNAEPETKVKAADAIEPVVGDYLKMQFVEHRVVPAILVS